jgi:nucleotide-binding universal stress UspA family protein
LVIGHHERSVLNRLILGSVAAAAVRGAPCDVLVVR